MPTREELKAIVHEYLVSKANKDRVGQLNDLPYTFQKVVKRMPNEAEQRMMLEAAHEAMLAGVVIFGRDLGQGYPWLWITEFGLRALKESKFPPYDPDGFIAGIKNAVAGIDNVCLQYLAEAVHAYAKGLPLSAAVMLGVASERLMILLMEAFSDWREVDKAKFLDATRGRSIAERYKQFRVRLDPKMELLPEALRWEIDTYLEGIFNLTRIIRNGAGHPTGTEVPQNVVFAHIQAFPEYARHLIALIAFFAANKHQ